MRDDTRNECNKKAYMTMANILDRYDEPSIYWENCETLLCAYTQMLNAGEDTTCPLKASVDDLSFNCCAQFCEYGFEIQCRIRDSMWTCK